MFNRIRSIVLVAIGRAEAVPFSQPEGWEAETDAFWAIHTCFACGWMDDATVENGVCTIANDEACRDRRASRRAHALAKAERRVAALWD